MPDNETDATPFSTEGYRGVFLAAPDGILIVDESGVVRDANPAAESMFDFSVEEMRGEPVELLVPEGARSRHREHRDRYNDDPHARPMGIGMELRGRRRDGMTFPVEISLSPLRTDGGTMVIAVVRDVSQHRRLRRFGAGTLRAAEEERQKLARELHDDTAQQLAASLLRIRMAQRAENAEERAAILDGLRSEILRTAESVRRIARGLRPPALQDVGLVAAVRAQVRRLEEAGDLEIELIDEVPGDILDDELDQDARLVIYRIIQEALSNAVRHSGADRVAVRLALADDGPSVVAEVHDEGRGFDPERVESSEGAGLGLIGMQERAVIVGGALELDAEPGGGTRVRLEIPIGRGSELSGERG